jgi:hypothetical protein
MTHADWLLTLSTDARIRSITLWNDIRQLLGGDFPEPAACVHEDDSIEHCWDRGEHHVSMRVPVGGCVEWFYRNRISEYVEFDEYPGEFLPSKMVKFLRTITPYPS